MSRMKSRLSGVLALCLTAGALGWAVAAERPAEAPAQGKAPALATATFAGGCFWCMEPPFDKLEGVVSTTSGYTGGEKKDPTYDEVSSGTTGHYEALQVRYDPSRVSYAQLLEVFWRNVDPLTDDGQFCDKGPQYRAALFVHDAEQRRLAEESLRKLRESKRFSQPIVTQVLPAAPFYPAEEYHQDYYRKNPLRYRYYRGACGRDARLETLWGAEAGGKK